MSKLDLDVLMSEYSRRGIQDWKDVNSLLRRKSLECLSNAIAENEIEAKEVIAIKQTKSLFVPMPMKTKNRKGFEWCFFLPKRNNGILNSLILFLLVNRARKNCLAFRFETSLRQGTPHGYPHMQLTRKTAESSSSSGNSIQGVPEWLPDSYPAFPIPAHNPLEMFLCMVTAVHGFRGGIDNLLIDIFQQAARPNDARKCIGKLTKMLNANP